MFNVQNEINKHVNPSRGHLKTNIKTFHQISLSKTLFSEKRRHHKQFTERCVKKLTCDLLATAEFKLGTGLNPTHSSDFHLNKQVHFVFANLTYLRSIVPWKA